ncbi:MAG TPA: hypothetical protein QGF58_18180 [Myxococcota bacterium]|nr:hypothetical protein [Myxococcota bacterium]
MLAAVGFAGGEGLDLTLEDPEGVIFEDVGAGYGAEDQVDGSRTGILDEGLVQPEDEVDAAVLVEVPGKVGRDPSAVWVRGLEGRPLGRSR